jgi:hypothetical protein
MVLTSHASTKKPSHTGRLFHRKFQTHLEIPEDSDAPPSRDGFRTLAPGGLDSALDRLIGVLAEF